jgi:hypothetical protein
MTTAFLRSLAKSTLLPLALALTALPFAGCDSGGGGGGGFRITSINLPKNAVWQINRPIKITFSQAVDFTTVNLNTINIRRVGGAPSAGEFFLESPSVVVFQPRCPTLDDLSDAGLTPGGVVYEMNVLGLDKQAAITVQSKNGASLSVGDTRTFSTPTSTLPLDLFFDPKVGPPAPVVRSQDASDDRTDACYIEIGGDPDDRVWFRLDANGEGRLEPETLVPLNKLSDEGTQVALVLYYDQPLNPNSENISASRLSWQFDAADEAAGAPDWRPLATEVRLVANCTETGAIVRITPSGVMPPTTSLRLVQAPEFSDIVGQTNLLVQDNFALADTDVGPTSPDPLADHFLDEYADAGDLDTQSALGAPPAVVEGGLLEAAFSFTGTGGPGGNFDWLIKNGQTVIFSTDTTTITGGPDFAATTTITVVGGVVDVDDFRIEQGGRLRIIGPNPFTLLASGKVEIEGEINVSGTDNPGVTTLNTTNIPQSGSPGQAGGGAGGTGSPLITASSPKGGNGLGAFNLPDGGGQGGETGWNNVANNKLNGRRGAGGGGGTFGSNQLQSFGDVNTYGDMDQSYIGLDVEAGFPNLDGEANGALTGPAGPLGGVPGPSPFADPDPGNNFFGSAVNDNGTPADPTDDILIQGELNKAWAGAGGGGGGDASFVGVGGTFPQTPFNPVGDEKGSGGAGGGGAFQILALGDIVFGPEGLIINRGGSGGGGENTLFLNRVGGGSGGGSGGHVILQTAGVIDMSLSIGPSSILGRMAGGIWATGGQGGAGKGDKGGATAGANGKVDTFPRLDACPPTLSGGTYPTTGDNACAGHIDGAGGDGGPGLVQLHAPDGWASILTPVGLTLGDVSEPTPLFFDADAGAGDPLTALLPGFGKESKARSVWIALGEGGFDKTDGAYRPATFEFGGIDAATGLVLTDPDGTVPLGPALLGPVLLASPPTVPSILDPRTLVLDAGPLVGGPQAYLLENLSLLRRYVLELSNENATVRFDVVAAAYDEGSQALTLTVSPDGPALDEKFGPNSSASLHEAFFRVASSGVLDRLPDSATIEVAFEATSADASGAPDLSAVVGPTFDIDELNNAPGNEDFRFIRYQITFDTDALDEGLSPSNPIPSLDFLRIPFRYQ